MLHLSAPGYKTLAVDLLEYACNSTHGRPEGDPVYDAVTEGRDPGPGYSSCADLAHWLLYRLGVRCWWVNRSEHKGFAWGMGPSRLAGNCPTRIVPPGLRAKFEPGDILLVWNIERGEKATQDLHVACMVEDRGDSVTTIDYGQPGGKLCNRTSGERDGKRTLGGKKIQVCVPLLPTLLHADARGELVAPQTEREYATRILGKPRSLRLRSPRMQGGDVAVMQAIVGAKADGVFGPMTDTALRAWQAKHSLKVDGVFGAACRAEAGI